jgi:hypothetical protein
MTNDLVFNRFQPNSVAGRMLSALAKRPMTVAELARVAKPKSTDNIMAPGGWYFQLRRFGKASRKFTLSVADNGRLVLKVHDRYRGQIA